MSQSDKREIGKRARAPGRLARHGAAGALAACLAVLAGCGGGGGSGLPPAPTPTPTPAPTPAPVPVAQDDPLFTYQWYLSNKGQDALASVRPVAGVDLNMGELHAQGVRGSGVRVAVVDSGLEIGHEDLAPNVTPGGSYNFINGSGDPTPTGNGGDHGTSVAGIIAAAGWNGKGGRGVAPEARLQGFNFLASQALADELAALGQGALSRDTQVFNMSYGVEPNALAPLSRSELTVREVLLRATRNNLGGIYVKSSGNGYLDLDGQDCSAANLYGVECQNANFDPRNALSEMIIVGAVNAAGRRSSYSTPGATLWVAGFGGEYGGNSRYQPSASGPKLEPAMVTTDLSGCQRGYNRAGGPYPPSNAIDAGGQSAIDPDCRYTGSFNGTSSAAPTVSGVVALMLQVNPALTQRDVKYILARTARPTDTGYGPIQYASVVLEPGWTTNAAGRRFSNWYGFGLVDASAAVAMARGFKPLAPQRTLNWQQNMTAVPIPYRDGNGSRGAIPIAVAGDLNVESVQVSFGTTHTAPANLRLVLTSPRGTRSHLLLPFSVLVPTPGGFEGELLSSNAFLDESSQGTWKLEVVDVTQPTGDTTAQLQGWAIRILGR
ncbi:S8 family serine peptidase [Variovorax terrae]|nr:S8 family serine peptidase [Variovorax terrae]